MKVLLFRLEERWFCLGLEDIFRVDEVQPVRMVPKLSNEVFKGVTYVAGHLCLFASLGKLLSLNEQILSSGRFVMLSKEGVNWAFYADEVKDVLELPELLEQKEAVVREDPFLAVAKIYDWEGKRVHHLNSEQIWKDFTRSTSHGDGRVK